LIFGTGILKSIQPFDNNQPIKVADIQLEIYSAVTDPQEREHLDSELFDVTYVNFPFLPLFRSLLFVPFLSLFFLICCIFSYSFLTTLLGEKISMRHPWQSCIAQIMMTLPWLSKFGEI